MSIKPNLCYSNLICFTVSSTISPIHVKYITRENALLRPRLILVFAGICRRYRKETDLLVAPTKTFDPHILPTQTFLTTQNFWPPKIVIANKFIHVNLNSPSEFSTTRTPLKAALKPLGTHPESDVFHSLLHFKQTYI